MAIKWQIAQKFVKAVDKDVADVVTVVYKYVTVASLLFVTGLAVTFVPEPAKNAVGTRTIQGEKETTSLNESMGDQWARALLSHLRLR